MRFPGMQKRKAKELDWPSVLIGNDAGFGVGEAFKTLLAWARARFGGTVRVRANFGVVSIPGTGL